MSIYLHGKTWWICIYHDGERIRESTGTTNKKAAQRYHDERKAQLWSQPRHTSKTFYQALVSWLEAGERSMSDRYSIRQLQQRYPDRPLHECQPEDFVEALKDKTPATFNRYRAIIVAAGHMSGVEIKIPQRKDKGKGRLRFLTHDEWERLYKELPAHLKPLALFSIKTGLRQHNVTHLRWSEIDLDRRVMWIHPDEAKAKKPIGIPLSDEAIALLTLQEGQHPEWVFPFKGRGRKEGGPVTKIKTAWQLAMERAGLGRFERVVDAHGKLVSKKWRGDFTWHGLRHTWASWHIMSGTPLEVLQKLGGWEDLRMVQRYAHLAPEYLATWAGNSKPWKQVVAKSVATCG